MYGCFLNNNYPPGDQKEQCYGEDFSRCYLRLFGIFLKISFFSPPRSSVNVLILNGPRLTFLNPMFGWRTPAITVPKVPCLNPGQGGIVFKAPGA